MSTRAGSIRTVALASLIGTTIEWYDFFLYGTAAALVFNRLYFPTFDPLTGTLAAFGTYTVGFVARPIGGIVIGHYGDRIGRKSMLVLTLVIMGVATFGIGLLPTYAQIGPWAAVALVVLRLAQGFGVGGEWGGAVLMAVEHAPAGRARILWQLAPDRRAGRTAPVHGGVRAVRAPAGRAVPDVGMARAVPAEHPARRRRPDHPRCGFWRRRRLRASRRRGPKRGGRSSSCSGPTRKRCCSRWARGSPRTARSTSTRCSSLVYGTQKVGLDRQTVLNGVLIAAACALVAIPLCGALSDRLGRRPVYLFGACVTGLFAYPLFWLLDTGSTPLVWLALVVALVFAHAPMYGPQAAFFSELFGTRVRYSGASLGSQLVVGDRGRAVAVHRDGAAAVRPRRAGVVHHRDGARHHRRRSHRLRDAPHDDRVNGLR